MPKQPINVPLENDEAILLANWCQSNNIRGNDWRVALIGYPGYYINEFGDMVTTKRNKPFRLLKRQSDRSGYQYYSLCVEKQERKIKVHRAVAMTFLANPNSLPMVNHKNGVKDDNRVSNLEWVTASENVLHAYKKLGFKSQGGVARKKIQCVETGVVYPSVRAAARSIGRSNSNTAISGAAKGRIIKCKGSMYKKKTCGGYHWRFI